MTIDQNKGMESRLGPVLDPLQLNRIEAVHRGFLYQHLYAVACLLAMVDTGARVLACERDEDIEVAWPERRGYLQIKTRAHPLQWADVRTAVEGFAAVRAEHAAGRRAGEPFLVLVANVEPGRKLAAMAKRPDWPQDVAIHWPGGPRPVLGLPPAWVDLAEALRWCTARAASVPFGSLAPQTLVAKLAAHIQHLAAGAGEHQITVDELPDLFEQFVEQLQAFPAVPGICHPHRSEPPADGEGRVRLIVGLAGAGKSTWAGRAAAHCGGTPVYFDVGDLPPAAVPSSLARELSARLLSSPGRPVEAAMLPSGTALELLAAVNRRVDPAARVTVVLDNVHRLDHADLRALVDTASCLRFVLLARPWEGQRPLEAYLGRPAETLEGWDEDTVAAVFAGAGCALDHPTARLVVELTGGLPLFVAGAAQLTRDSYGRDARAFCAALRERLHLTTTAQDILIGYAFAGLSGAARQVAAVLADAAVPLTMVEAQQLAAALVKGTPTILARAVRELVGSGLAQTFGDGRVKLHDSAGTVAAEEFEQLLPEQSAAVRCKLAELLEEGLSATRDIRRFGRWLRLQAQLGKVDVLVEIAGEEHFQEIGLPDELRGILGAIAADEQEGTSHRFRAANALATWCHGIKDRAGHAAAVGLLRELADGADLDEWESGTLALRLLTAAGEEGDVEELRCRYGDALSRTSSKQVERIVRYTYATGLLYAGRYAEAGREALEVAADYYEHFGLDVEDVVGASAEETRALVESVGSWVEDCKHLADCLFLYVVCCRHLNASYGLAAMHAMKFYYLSGAWRSMVAAGQDAVDNLLEIGAVDEALQLIDRDLLPLTTQLALLEQVIGLRSQRAVIVAYRGEPEAALAELEVLEQYELTADQALDLQAQRRLVESMAVKP
ncbi:hypothetical protein CFP65_1381 [Kitasatospora sp. MMS16-BH015]|uniref:hypothetical protein n=1 Tax=Kitasatospora sp. MMS16-BH015 TaxID=2018025 RepID=UPI000CA36D35|nr:hypothetical protein [Kitasatospora sp. MMS16-BH015]AUG76280.1 hypothetical protein CFP65_1381 [Kitasatospora sp. MMS16-BH015]